MASIARRSNGWQVQIRRHGCKPLSKNFKSVADARAWARSIESEVDRGLFVDRTAAEQTTVADLLARYEREITPRKRGVKEERSRLKALTTSALGPISLARLRSMDVAEYRDTRLRAVCGTTVQKELNLIAHAVETARREWGIHVENPVRLVARPKANRARDRRLMPGDEAKLAAATGSAWLPALIGFALETGMRRGELVNMRWQHVNAANRTLVIPMTKNGEAREVPISTRALQILHALPRRLDGRVFGLTHNGVTQAFERAARRAGLDDLRFHDLRHEAVSRFFERGFNMMEVAAISGHKTLQMLKRYTHLKAETLAQRLA